MHLREVFLTYTGKVLYSTIIPYLFRTICRWQTFYIFDSAERRITALNCAQGRCIQFRVPHDRCAVLAFVLLRLWKARSLTIACCSHSHYDLEQQSRKCAPTSLQPLNRVMFCLIRVFLSYCYSDNMRNVGEARRSRGRREKQCICNFLELLSRAIYVFVEM